MEAFENVGLGIPQYLLEIALKVCCFQRSFLSIRQFTHPLQSRKFRDRYTDSGFEMKGAKQQGKFGPGMEGNFSEYWHLTSAVECFGTNTFSAFLFPQHQLTRGIFTILERAGLGTGKWAEAGSGKKKRETAESRTIRVGSVKQAKVN